MPVIVIVTAFCLAVAAEAQPPTTSSSKDVVFNHLTDGGDRAYERRLSDGEKFNVVINDTCPDEFAYEVHGIVRETAAGPGQSLRGGPKGLETKSLPIVHNARFGGYIVSITRTDITEACIDSDKLKPGTLIISTPSMEWDLAFSGGFTVSSLTNPQFFLRPHPTEAGKTQVQEDPDKEDAVSLGIATFVHLYHQQLPWLAGTFGLGIREGNKTEYFLGGGFRFADKATLNAGVVFGPVTRLPTGVNTTDAVVDSNVLNNLPTHLQKGFFVGISYSFINVRDKLQQPFAGSGATWGGTGAGTGPAGGQVKERTCSVRLDKGEVTLSGEKGASDTITIDPTDVTCEWQLVARESVWAAFSATSGKGKQTLTITTTEENNGPADRYFTVNIGDQPLKLMQKKK